jgi:cytidylate kinase
MSFVVTIDGPAAAGKSTTARAVAERLGIQFLDTGAFYRAVARKALDEGSPLTDGDRIAALLERTRIETGGLPSRPSVWLDGCEVTEAIRAPEVSEAASQVAALPEVRRVLVAWQRAMRARGPLVGEGRDLGTVVFPDAEVKIFLDADLETRAQRRHREMDACGLAMSLAAVREDLARRDARDRTRSDSPLEAAADAIHVDTSGLSLAAQVDAVLAVVRAHPGCPAAPPAG